MFEVRKLNNISEEKIKLLPKELYNVSDNVEEADAMILRSYKMHGMELPKSLKAVARAGAGVNNIPLDDCTDKGIVVFNTPGANANGVKELVLASLFLSSRKITKGVNWIKGQNGTGQDIPKLVEKGKSQFAGPEIKGKKLGVIGLGAIGAMVANDALALGMEVEGYDPFISVDAAWGLSCSVIKETSLDNLLATCDYITIHIPLNEKTKGLINKDKFAIMKKGMRIINLARGGILVKEDLIEALGNGTVSTYVTDFPQEEYLTIDNVITIPHLGASTPESEENCASMAVEELRDFLENGNITNSVNFPNCSLPHSGNTRVIIGNKNVPNMVGQITTILAQGNINIATMINRHSGTVGYNIIDIEGEITEDIILKLKSVEGILMVRVI
ncbi:MAG: phosphoglycerate dehydrogenase [Clostridiaceae bacterium]